MAELMPDRIAISEQVRERIGHAGHEGSTGW